MPPFKRYEKKVPGHPIQVDVKFLFFVQNATLQTLLTLESIMVCFLPLKLEIAPSNLKSQLGNSGLSPTASVHLVRKDGSGVL
ncbi:MAG: hypothetical protein ACXWTP_01840 [Methylosarcina sp.]